MTYDRFRKFVEQGRIAQLAIDELTKREAEGPFVHHMRAGLTPCNMPGYPSDWPPGHRWSERWSDVTCPRCLEKKPF